MKFFNKSKNTIWQIGVGSSLVGLIASFMQAAQTISYYKEPSKSLACEINSVFSCSGVFDAWQSSVFGFSNSLMCLLFFSVILGFMIAGATGSKINKTVRLSAQYFTIFFLLFGAWYLWSSAFVIGSLCIYCIFCYAGVIALNGVWLRINANDLPLSKANSKRLKAYIKKDYDIRFWVIWATVFVLMFLYRFL